MMASSSISAIASSECAEISIKVASTRRERQGAFQLAYNSYHRAGLCDQCVEQLRITPHQLLTTTDIIVAELRGEVISTLSLVRDGELGLPLEAIYPDVVDRKRAAGLKLAEVSCLADRRKDAARFFGLFCELARVMVQMAHREAVDQLLIAVHPRHARMYCRAMAFRQVGDNRGYPAVKDNPAVLLCLDLEEGKTTHPERWARFVGDPLPGEVTASRPMCELDRWYFERMASRLEAAALPFDAPDQNCEGAPEDLALACA